MSTELQVAKDFIQFLLDQVGADEEELVDVDTTGADLYVRPEVRLSRPLGIASWMTAAALRNIRYRLVQKSDK